MTHEIPDLFDIERLDAAISHVADNVVLLNYAKRDDAIQRAISVIKTRASQHDPAIRQFSIGTDGISLVHTGTTGRRPRARHDGSASLSTP